MVKEMTLFKTYTTQDETGTSSSKLKILACSYVLHGDSVGCNRMEVICFPTEISNVGFSRDGKEIVLLCNYGSHATLYCWDTDIPRVRSLLISPHLKFLIMSFCMY